MLIDKNFIETSRSMSGKKVVLLGHSMGSQVIFWFMKWFACSVEIQLTELGSKRKVMETAAQPGAMII